MAAGLSEVRFVTRSMLPSRGVFGCRVLVGGRVGLAACALAVFTGCADRLGVVGSAEGGAESAESAELARARRLADPSEVLPPRPEVIALAQSLEASAVREGAGARAVAQRRASAALYTRLWRLEHRAQDAAEALDLARAASKDLGIAGACEAALDAASLAGEAAMDATTTYVELYAVKRRGGEICGEQLDERLARLAPFRPEPRILDGIEQALAAQGTLARGATSAKAAVRSLPRITRVEHWGGPEAARVVVHLDRAAKFRVADIGRERERGARTYVELDGVDLGEAPPETPLGGIVTRVVAEATSTGSRVALDLEGPAYRRVFHLLEPFRVVLDVAKAPPGAAGRARGAGRAVERVVLDPGHGGVDPGAIGPSGVREKDVTLAIAHKAAPVLARLGFQVSLTRDEDRSVTLEERTARANGVGADLFVSIHCNAADNKTKRGIETYVLDTTTSDMAGRVAARENAASQAASDEVAQLLASMRLADQSSRSVHFAELLQRATVAAAFERSRPIEDGGVHRAGFYVLVGARMPAVLFETSYVSNLEDERLLASDAFQQRLADGIVNAIKAYKEGR